MGTPMGCQGHKWQLNIVYYDTSSQNIIICQGFLYLLQFSLIIVFTCP